MRRLLLTAACALACCLPAIAAESLGISPLRLDLTTAAMSGTLVVRNDGDAAADVIVAARAWAQSDAQPVVLTDTRDIVAYPPSFQLQPNEARTVRVGTLRAPEPAERTYRVIITELPADGAAHGMLQFVPRLSVPVFVGGSGPGMPHVAAIAIHGQTLDVTLAGATARHALVREVHIDGLDATGRNVASITMPGWYVLSGSEQRIRGRLADGTCSRIVQLRVRIVDDDGAAAEHVIVPTRACSAAS